jgi:type I restriction enzyme S subunit
MSEPLVPDGWTQATVRNLIYQKFTGPSPTSEERPIASDEEWGLLKTTAITWKGWNEDAHKVPPRSYWGNASIEVHPGDVLVTKAGPRHRVGVVVHVGSTRPHLMVSGKMIGLRPRTAVVLPQVLAGLLATSAVQEFLNTRTTGMAESQVNFADEALLATRLNVPSIGEQRRIAEILDAVDAQIRSTQRIIEKLHSAESGMTAALLAPALSAARVDGDTTPPSLPPGWRTGPLVDFCTLQRGFDITQAEQREGPYPVISSSGVTSYHDRFMVDGPGVVTGRKGSLGGVYYCEGRFWPHDTSLWVKDFHGNDPRFIALLLKSLRLERFDAATSVPTLNRNTVHPLCVAVPTSSEQQEIVSALKKFTSRANAEEASLAKLQRIRSGLLSDLLTGCVRVPERAA